MGRDSAFGHCLGLLLAGAEPACCLRCWLESEHAAAFAMHLIFKFKSYWFGGVVWLTGWFCDGQGEPESRLGSSSGSAARETWVQIHWLSCRLDLAGVC